jgi:hypothetical protein
MAYGVRFSLDMTTKSIRRASIEFFNSIGHEEWFPPPRLE